MISDCVVLCCLFDTDSGAVEFFTTDWLLQKTAVDPINRIPIILNMSWCPSIKPTAIFIAQYSDPKAEVVYRICHFEHQQMGAL